MTTLDFKGQSSHVYHGLKEFRCNSPSHPNFMFLSENEASRTTTASPSLIKDLTDSIRNSHINGSRLVIPALFKGIEATRPNLEMTQSDIL